MTVKSELEKVLSTKQKRSEKPADYRKRLAQTVQDVPDDDWEALSEETQLWVNSAAKAIEAGKPVPDFPKEAPEEEEDEPEGATADAENAEDGEEEGDPEDEEEEEEKKPAKKAAAKKSAAGNGEKAPKAPKEPRGSVCRDIKKIVIKHPNYSVEELVAAAEKAGLSPARSTLATIRSDTRDTIKIMQDAGLVSMGV